MTPDCATVFGGDAQLITWQPFEELLASTEPLDRSLNADLVLEAHIPKHIVTVLSRLVESLHAVRCCLEES